jgi:uncharacterized protein (DUF58 family)
MRRLSITSTGVGLAVAAVACYGVGVALGYRLLVIVSVGLLAMLVAGVIPLTVRPSVALSRLVAPDRVSVGEPALGRLHVRNLSRWPSPAFTAVDLIGGEALSLGVRPLAGRGRRTLHYPVHARRRGRLRLGPLTVERRDALGLFAWRQRQTDDGVLWVHPRVHPMRPLPVGIVPDYEGRTTEHARLGTVTFSSLREYVPGDDPRQIHWRTTARTGHLIVREHIDTMEPTTTVVLDTRTDVLAPDAFEDAVELVASVIRAVEGAGRPAALHIQGERPAEAIAAGARGSLDRLALAQQSADADPLPLLETVDRVPPGGALVVVTGAVVGAVLGRLAEQRRRFAPVVVVAIEPDGQAVGIQRRPGLAVLTARSAAEGVAAWHRMITGDVG